MEWVASTLHTTSEHGLSSITTADAHTSVASSRLNRRSRRFKWTRLFRRKTKCGFCSCAITFQTQSTAGGLPTLPLFELLLDNADSLWNEVWYITERTRSYIQGGADVALHFFNLGYKPSLGIVNFVKLDAFFKTATGFTVVVLPRLCGVL